MENYFGRNIRFLRSKHNMKQEDLADKISVCRQTISNYERGERFCDLSTLIEISELFDVSIDDLLKKPLDHN